MDGDIENKRLTNSKRLTKRINRKKRPIRSFCCANVVQNGFQTQNDPAKVRLAGFSFVW
jgi:hypothetical protein